MDVLTLDRKKYIWLHCVALSLLMYSLAGCALPVTPPPKDVAPSAQHGAIQAPIRVILYFKRPTADNKSLSAAISEACLCQPVFFRPYLGEALIYEITLPQGAIFDSFEKTLMLNAVPFGIKAVELDELMRH